MAHAATALLDIIRMPAVAPYTAETTCGSKHWVLVVMTLVAVTRVAPMVGMAIAIGTAPSHLPKQLLIDVVNV